MDTSEHIETGDALLVLWGRFASKRTDSGLGFPKISPSFKDAIKGRGSIPLVSNDVFLVDSIMGSLKNDEKELFWSVYWWYVKAVPLSVCAARLRCTERTIRNRLNRARVLVGSAFEKQKKGGGR